MGLVCFFAAAVWSRIGARWYVAELLVFSLLLMGAGAVAIAAKPSRDPLERAREENLLSEDEYILRKQAAPKGRRE